MLKLEITLKWLKEKSACRDGYEWSVKMLNDKPMDSIEFINALIKDDKLLWASWVIVRIMERSQYLKYAIFSAEQVIDIFENKYPENKAPREAIEAAKIVLENDTPENRKIAWAKRCAAYAAAYAAADDAADAAAYAAAYAAADDAAYADAAYADAAYAAAAYAYAAAAAADAAAAYNVAKHKMLLKILTYGLSLLITDIAKQ